jgi:uncharacterized membrane protein required for colicin V production
MKCGFIAEFFKFLGALVSIYVSMHYYSALSNLISARFGLKAVAPESIDFICFLVLALAAYLFFVMLRKIFTKLVKTEAIPQLSKWGGLCLGAIRGLMVIGLLLYILILSTLPYMQASVKKSYSGKTMVTITAGVYRGVWDGFMSKFMAQEKYNGAVTIIEDHLNKS